MNQHLPRPRRGLWSSGLTYRYPRDSNDAFRDAEYADPITRYERRRKWINRLYWAGALALLSVPFWFP